jgi:hypothetical protein
MDSEKKLLMTMTGEIHQPVRLYYQVVDQAAVLNVFAKLRCLDDDQDTPRTQRFQEKCVRLSWGRFVSPVLRA